MTPRAPGGAGAPGSPTWAAATGNPGKLQELRALLAPHGLRLSGRAELGVTKLPAETGTSYEENALLKAGFVALKTGLVTLADDSGLEVDALGGEPGVRSARYGGDLSDLERIAYLLARLRHVPEPERTARFVSVVVLAHPNGDVAEFRGSCEGRILQGPRGEGGFGYDPIFLSNELGCTFAEATSEAKNAVSHRGRALAALTAWLAGDASRTRAESDASAFVGTPECDEGAR